MEFREKISELKSKIELYRPQVKNEEMTKTVFILPFLEVLGYDTRNPFEVHAEYDADIANLKGEKVDYAILINDVAQILIEAKSCEETLDKEDKQFKQLARYFQNTKAKLGILTNGIIYKFYTDLDKINIMDEKPFLEINVLNLKDGDIAELRKYTKMNFNLDNILTSAEELKYSNAIKKHLKNDFIEPSDDFIEYLIGVVYEGRKTQQQKDRFIPIIKKSLEEFINDYAKDKVEQVFSTNKIEEKVAEVIETVQEKTSNVITTEEELEGLGIIKAILREELKEIEKISYRDAVNYFSIILDGSIRKWVCRLYFNSSNKQIAFPEFDINGEKTTKELKYPLENGLNSLYDHKDKILESLRKNLKD